MNIQSSIRVIFIKYGIALGLILTGLSIFSFYFITQITKSPVFFVAGPIIFSLFIPIIITVYFCFSGRRAIGGYWTFRQATSGIFVMFIIAYFIQLIGKDIIFNKYIEPNSIQKTQAAALNAKAFIDKQRGDPRQRIDQDISQMKNDFKQQQTITVSSTIRGMAISILFIFVFALIFAAIFKKDPPFSYTGSDGGS